MSRHRSPGRPRYGRIAVLAVSVTVSVVAALAGFGVLATGSAQAGSGPKPAAYTGGAVPTGHGTPSGNASSGSTPDATQLEADGADQPMTSPGATGGHDSSDSSDTSGVPPTGQASGQTSGRSDTALPADSGHGRRIVFSQSRQRVWLVDDAGDDVQRTYLVSGSVTHNLQPGTYSVYSKSRWAVGVDDSGVMQYFVRFTQGPTGAAIGFHSIPTKNGVPLQTRAQLGTPQSHGCIRQYLPNAIALWNFAPIGTKVVVVA
jgi:lipoprotein-anchoring transpeptidase ErfK/SrfK